MHENAFVNPEWLISFGKSLSSCSVGVWAGEHGQTCRMRHWDVCSLLSAIEKPFMRRALGKSFTGHHCKKKSSLWWWESLLWFPVYSIYNITLHDQLYISIQQFSSVVYICVSPACMYSKGPSGSSKFTTVTVFMSLEDVEWLCEVWSPEDKLRERWGHEGKPDQHNPSRGQCIIFRETLKPDLIRNIWIQALRWLHCN